MGSKGASPSSSPSSSSSVCCMCGDHGLPQELFRCKICHFRSQHNDLYLKVDTYRACNWCLREDGGKYCSLLESNTDTVNSNSSFCSSSNGGMGVSRGSFSSNLNKPIKKQRVPQRSLSDVNERMRSKEISPGLGRSRQAFRGKVRRYKLLEEVSS
ncbi:uncharacterized protein LOC109822821 isoform X2 [Asparagus officinalis]|uniref:uncharacterized protein LOC109822821 isoform X2 n=1 Tax=Asparagus officinalis TaxID=4686 RepID=UPI00098DFFF8|nr:uncharacterized protein LOC109822821 isoform X2 [Asparagus officinalis]